MLSKLFGKKKHKEFEVKFSEVEFVGDLDGNAVNALRFEVGKILKTFPCIRNAYLSAIQYKGEKKPRISLVIESSEPSEVIGADVANQCAGIVPMDIMFLDSCSPSLLEKILSNTEPLFNDSNLLFECPLIVSRGNSQDMPEEWSGAILNYFVAAKDYEAALYKSVNDLRSDGYKFESVHDGKVNQLDPTVWWEQYVMGKWSKYADHFPSQEDIEIILVTGGIHKGPALGWENEQNNT